MVSAKVRRGFHRFDHTLHQVQIHGMWTVDDIPAVCWYQATGITGMTATRRLAYAAGQFGTHLGVGVVTQGGEPAGELGSRAARGAPVAAPGVRAAANPSLSCRNEFRVL